MARIAGRSCSAACSTLLRVRLRVEVQVRRGDAQAIGAQLHLPGRLLAGHVEDRAPGHGGGEPLQRGEEERALADARVAAEQHERAGHDPAAEHAVELADAGAEPALLARLDLVQRHRPRCASDAAEGPGCAALLRRGELLVEGVPPLAGRALAEPLGRRVAAFTAREDGLLLGSELGHGVPRSSDESRRTRSTLPWRPDIRSVSAQSSTGTGDEVDDRFLACEGDAHVHGILWDAEGAAARHRAHQRRGGAPPHAPHRRPRVRGAAGAGAGGARGGARHRRLAVRHRQREERALRRGLRLLPAVGALQGHRRARVPDDDGARDRRSGQGGRGGRRARVLGGHLRHPPVEGERAFHARGGDPAHPRRDDGRALRLARPHAEAGAGAAQAGRPHALPPQPRDRAQLLRERLYHPPLR